MNECQKLDWKQFVGRKLSVQITGKGNKKEIYMGIVKEVTADFMRIQISYKKLTEVLIRLDMIESSWVYA
jgi:ribosome maturation factor RimP